MVDPVATFSKAIIHKRIQGTADNIPATDMDQYRIKIGTSSQERNNRNIQANRGEHTYNNLTSTSLFSKPTNIRDNFTDQSKIIKDIQINLSSLSLAYGILNDMMHKLNAELVKVKNERDAMASEIGMLRDSIDGIRESLGRKLDDGFYNVAAEVQERYERSKNVLVFNVPDSMDETPEMLRAVVVNLLKTLKYKYDFPEINRLGNYRGLLRPIRMVFKSTDYVQMVLKHKNKLHASEYFKNSWIGEDRTITQRLKFKSQSRQSSETKGNNEIQDRYS